MKNIGIVCEGPTDYIILKEIVDKITGEENYYVQLQPEPNLTGNYGNGAKRFEDYLILLNHSKDRRCEDEETIASRC